MSGRLDEVRAHVEDIERWSKDPMDWDQNEVPERIATDMRWLLDEVGRCRAVLAVAERIADADSSREADRLLPDLVDAVEAWRMVR